MPQAILPIHNTNDYDTGHIFAMVDLNDQLIELITRRHQIFCEAQAKDADILEIRYWDNSVITYFGYFKELEDGSLIDSAGDPIIDIEDRLAGYEIIVLQTPIVLPNSCIGSTDAEQIAIRKEGVWWSASTPHGTYIDTALISMELIGFLKKAKENE